ARRTPPAWAKGLVVLSVLALSVVLVRSSRGQASAEPDIIADRIVYGNRSIPTDKILRYVKLQPGSTFSWTALQEDAARLLQSGLFRNVRADKKVEVDPRSGESRLIIFFEISEFPTIVQEVIYKNAHHISVKDLEEMTRIRKGMPLDPTLNKKACYEIQDSLRKEGRFFATVNLEEGARPGDNRVVFNISEGPIVRVRAIDFTGQEALATAARLRTQVDSSRPFLYLIGGKFNPAMVDGDVSKLEEYYRNSGYLSVRITREMKFSDDFQWVDLIFHVQEGQHYRIKDIEVQGTHRFDNAEVGRIIQAHAGEYYNEGVVTADMRNMSD